MRRPAPARIPLFRLPSRRTLAVVALSTIAAAMVWGITSRASQAAASLGTTTPVWVAEGDLDPGDIIESGDVTLRDWPVAFVPGDAIGDDPTGLTVRSGIATGEAVIGDRVAENGSGPAALIPSGWRGVAVSTFDAPPPVEPGSLVDVIINIDPAFGSSGGGVLVSDAVVVHVHESGSTVTVAIPADDVPALTSAQMAGAVSLALAG